jgi:hypothetical protein
MIVGVFEGLIEGMRVGNFVGVEVEGVLEGK